MGSGFRTFQSGEVLTSSNVQNFLMDQSVMVFAGTAARGSAIASPETGMVSYRTDGTADSKREGFEFYDGASWARLVPATTSPGLELVTSQTIGSAVSSVTVSNCFSATYDNYKVIVSGGAGSTTSGLSLRVGAAATAYAYMFFQSNYNGTAANDNSTNATSYAPAGGFTTNSLSMNVDILSPFLTENTIFFSNRAIPDTTSVAGAGAGFLNNTTSYTDLTILTSSGTITGGTIRVYGYRN